MTGGWSLEVFMRKRNIFISLLMSFSVLLSTNLPATTESTLRICDDVDEPASLDPFQVFAEKVITVIQQVNEGLIRFDPEGKMEPALAESWKRIDEKTIRFDLRKGVAFHNGEIFDARSVKFSLERYVNPETKFPGAGFLGTIAGVNVVDNYTVDVITSIPDGLILNRLAAFGQIVPPVYYQKVGPENFGKSPIGTGPFVFSSWTPKENITLLANKSYWKQGYPKVKELIFMFIPALEQMGNLIDKKVDIVTELPGTMTLRLMETGKAKIVKKQTLYIMIGVFNINRGPLKDIRVRQALNLAINREDFISYEVRANGQLIATTTMAGEEGHDPTLKPYPFDPEKAKKLLRDAGYENGFTLEAIVKEQGVRAMGVVKSYLERIGVNLKITTTTDANIVQDIASKPWDILFGGCPDPMVHSFFIQSIILYSKSPYAICQNPAFDQRLEEMMTTLDDVGRAKKARNLDRYMYDNNLGIFTYQRIKTYGVAKNVVFIPPLTGMPHFYNTEKR
jgi:peptide/nickel transport system substrate-binding protein